MWLVVGNLLSVDVIKFASIQPGGDLGISAIFAPAIADMVRTFDIYVMYSAQENERKVTLTV